MDLCPWLGLEFGDGDGLYSDVDMYLVGLVAWPLRDVAFAISKLYTG
jgi:hypothetical protein